MDMYLPALPAVTGALHTSPASAQMTISVYLLGMGLGQLVVGPTADRLGRRGPMLAGIALYLVASAVCGVATGIGVMIAARLLQALGASAGVVVPRAIVRDRYQHDEVLHMFSLLSLVFGIAPILAPMLGGWVLTVASWRWIFGLQALFALVMGTSAFFRLPESRTESTRIQAAGEHPFTTYLALLRERRLLGYLLTGSFSGCALFAYITASPEIIISIYHVPPEHFGWVFGANAAGMIGAAQLNARLARRIPGSLVLRWALLAPIAAALVLLLCVLTGFGGLWGVLVPLFLVIASLGFVQPNATAGAMNVDPSRAGATSALLGASFMGVGSLTGVPMAWLHDGTARPLAIVILGGVLLAVIAFEALVRRRPVPVEEADGAAEDTGRGLGEPG
jgi:DHA1 family bicyclomycin/chloramphenicol resistance-like MFS transporter